MLTLITKVKQNFYWRSQIKFPIFQFDKTSFQIWISFDQPMLTRSSHRDNFQRYLYFYPRSTFFWIFKDTVCVYRTDTNFQEGIFVRRTDKNYQLSIFQEQFYLATELIAIFKEHLFGYRTDTDFPGCLFQT